MPATSGWTVPPPSDCGTHAVGLHSGRDLHSGCHAISTRLARKRGLRGQQDRRPATCGGDGSGRARGDVRVSRLRRRPSTTIESTRVRPLTSGLPGRCSEVPRSAQRLLAEAVAEPRDRLDLLIMASEADREAIRRGSSGCSSDSTP